MYCVYNKKRARKKILYNLTHTQRYTQKKLVQDKIHGIIYSIGYYTK